ncbi:hypothetical protein [Cupriavidus pinatubonensis]|uniref:Uncharacterized protein n=1 Tax=Cupriavidus pinatubonensis TaxID=248026 RepID=A0ABM8WR76_9BURK|nr:hypothetical protein [Cupriavidus pinatubonensis]CAG9169939.1 hypothetical protein LMG23994_01739 [Cupriavidus pinatubonensis]
MRKTATIRLFTRDPNSQVGFQSTNRASTDAINALEQWKVKVVDRDYQVQQDFDNALVVLMTMDARDTTAGLDLEAECVRCGVIHKMVEPQ